MLPGTSELFLGAFLFLGKTPPSLGTLKQLLGICCNFSADACVSRDYNLTPYPTKAISEKLHAYPTQPGGKVRSGFPSLFPSFTFLYRTLDILEPSATLFSTIYAPIALLVVRHARPIRLLGRRLHLCLHTDQRCHESP